jgi:hypothetical protein
LTFATFGVIFLPGDVKKNKVVVNQPQNGGQFKDKKKNSKQPKTKESTKRQSMLNTHKINPFKYDMNEILTASAMDPAKASAFLASVIAKASRVSSRDAKDFIRTFVDSGDITKDESEKMCKLLDRYSKFR